MSLAARSQVPITSHSTPADSADPVGARAFATAMARLGPFEAEPAIAVAVSGGRDSMALVLLAAEWAAAQGGTVSAVTVDHRLRPESGDEARQVAGWLERHGIAHETMIWHDSPGPGGAGMGASEAAARNARYALLEEYCGAHGILHLLVGHHRDDQAETHALRRTRGSGIVGRAGMPAVRELTHTRILRPLLGLPRARLTATLAARGQGWIDDPSNRDTRFARARLRLRPGGVRDRDPAAGDARREVEGDAARLSARAVVIDPAGFAVLDPAMLDGANDDARRRLSANLLVCVAGVVYPPRGARLERAVARILERQIGAGVTLGGCILREDGRGRIMVSREPAAITPPRAVNGHDPAQAGFLWDGRFRVTGIRPGDVVGAVVNFRAQGVPEHPESWLSRDLPRAVRDTLPAVLDGGTFRVCALQETPAMATTGPTARFSPVLPLAGARFATSR